MNELSYIQHKDINKVKWDDCIDKAPNGLIYAYAWYLDAMAEHWDALVLGNYDAVMPVTWNKKYGIYYLFQPFFCASLGIFSKTNPDKFLVELFLSKIPAKYKYIDIYLNHQNLFAISGFPLTERCNYILSLNSSYKDISENYRSNLKRNIKKAEATGLIVKTDIDLQQIMTLAKDTMQRVSPISDEEIKRFENLFTKAKNKKSASTYGIFSKNDELLASAVFFFSHNRWYYILVGNHPNGKTIGASHYLIDRFIADHASTNTILDFEGSDIRNLAFFYSSYGATEEKFPALRMNKLPALLKWLKK